jgi:hypothetical protein
MKREAKSRKNWEEASISVQGKRGQAPFLMFCPQLENVLFLTKKGPVPILLM